MRRRFMKKSKPKTYSLTVKTIAGATVSVNGMTQTANSSGYAYFELEPRSYLYSVTVSGYMIRQNYVTVNGNTSVTETNFYPIPSHYASIYIYDANGTYGSSPGSNPIGIYVENSYSSFILSLTCFGTGQGDGNSSAVEALSNTPMSNVLSDYNGRSNFSTMVSRSSYADSTYYVLGKINNFSAGNIGKGQWYIPSGGQMGIIQQYYREIVNACNRCGSYPNISHIIYTSTRCTSSYAPEENTSGSVFAPDIHRGAEINERNVRFDQWSNIFYWAVADKP